MLTEQQLLNGKEYSLILNKEIKSLIEENKLNPTLAIIQVGNNKASEVYVKQKTRLSDEVGIKTKLFNLPTETTTKELSLLIESLNNNKNIDGILLQLPLPSHINENIVTNKILHEKDVDCFTNQNAGAFYKEENSLIKPLTPMGIMKLLEYYKIPLVGKKALVIGRSNIVGKPIAKMLLDKHCTVTIVHSKSKDLAKLCQEADIIITATGVRNTVTNCKNNAVVIDVGITRDENNKLIGDVNRSLYKEKPNARFSPVPGGIGPLTVSMLAYQTAILSLRNKKN